MIDKQFKIKLICIYYGMLPEWFPLWLKSCSKNPNYDFLLITDQKYENTYAKNVEIKNLSWEELKHKFENVLEMPISLEKPYKLCDFRPIFGMAFADELKEYDFWGHCDLDMIWGDLSEFVTEEDLSVYDRIGLYGAFTIYRNTDENRKLYKKYGASFSYKRVFSNSESYLFDEMPGMNCICVKNNIKWKTKIKIADIDTYLMRYGSDLLVTHETFSWESGVAKHYYLENNVVISDRVAYIHFSGKKPRLKTKQLEQVVFDHNSIIELNKAIENPEDLIQYSGFISAEDDSNQRKYNKKIRSIKIFKSTLTQKMVRLVNQLYIRRFYKYIQKS